MLATRLLIIFRKRDQPPTSMDFATPRTPPRSASENKKNDSKYSRTPAQTPAGKTPHFLLPDTTPKLSKNLQLHTPANRTHLATPHSKGKTLLAPPNVLPLSPEFTPQRARKKKTSVEDLFGLAHISPLMPSHSTVGSGRKGASAKTLRAPIALDFAELSKINENLTFEQDEVKDSPDSLDYDNDYDNGLDIDYDAYMASPSKRRRRKQLLATPGAQLITDEKVHQWHGKSRNTNFSSDESDTESAPLVNPFLAPSLPARKRAVNPFSLKPAVDYATHVEYINHRTGERRVEELLESQRRIGPKKLDFSGL